MLVFLLLPFFVQTVVIGIDEFYFHRKRGLPKWERLGHPLDTLTVLLCFSFLLFFPYSTLFLKIYCALAVFSAFFVTKDEFVHKECCSASEQWLHSLLFLNHPIVLASAGLLWPVIHGVALFSWMDSLLQWQEPLRQFLLMQTLFTMLFFFYQIFYWNLIWKDNATN